ncbi:MAG: hypothetical protein JST37_02450 [Bacteroidetes bacterium]|jgi:hypothetical protein|nr:hypothetical protein [Bacteroidota bacterium]MBS1980249.1 hypothetical protein [Bacteroidota bacterium]
MTTINLNNTVFGVPLTAIEGDMLNISFSVKDQNGNPFCFTGSTNYINFPSARLIVKTNETPSTTACTFTTSTGNTYYINNAQRNVGVFVLQTPALNIANGNYYYVFQVYNSTNIQTIFNGKFDVLKIV